MKVLRPIVGLSLLAVVILGLPQPAAAAVIAFTSDRPKASTVAGGAFADQANALKAAPVITITSGRPPSPVTAYEPYPTHTFNASGGTEPYSVALRSGSIPTGMSLSSGSRRLAGTPTTPGSYTFGVRVVDALGYFADQDVTVVVVAPAIRITSGTPTSPWYTGQPYPTHTFTASGGAAPHSVTLRSGSLPVGMSLSSVSGNLAGTPITPGSYTFAVRVLDAHGFFADQSVTVVIADPAAAITSGTPKKGTVGRKYSFRFTATGDSNIAFSVTAGNLPPGLKLAPGGVLSGTPTRAGSFRYTVKATGMATSAEKEVTQVIAPAPPPRTPHASPSAGVAVDTSPTADASPTDSVGATDNANASDAAANGNGGLAGTGGNTSVVLLVAGLTIALGGLLLVLALRRLRATE